MNEEEVFDIENEGIPLGDGDAPSQPDGDPVSEAAAEQYAHGMIGDYLVWGQERMGERKLVSVAPMSEERPTWIMLDDGLISPKELGDHLWEAWKLFGDFTLVVEEYKVGSKKMYAISQAIQFGGKDLSRTITEVRISAAREIYGFLVNRGVDRFILLNTAKTAEEKQALENPVWFGSNSGFEV